MLSRAAFLVRDNYNTLLIDMRDHGESGGTYAGPGYMESRDILGALKYLQDRGERGPIAVMGHSYGAVAGLYAATKSPDIAAVIADGAFISFEDMVSRADERWRAKIPGTFVLGTLGVAIGRFPHNLVGSEADLLSSNPRLVRRKESGCAGGDFSHWHATHLLSLGEKDEICPPQNAKRMYDAARRPEKLLLVVPNAEHDTTYSTNPQLYESTVVGFLEKALQRAALVGESRICQTCK